MHSSTSIDGEGEPGAKITKISLDKAGFFSTPRGQTAKKIIIIALIAMTIAGIACVPPLAAFIPLGIFAIHIGAAALGGSALLIGVVASLVLYRKENARYEEKEIASSSVSDTRTIEGMRERFNRDNGRGMAGDGVSEARIFTVNGGKIQNPIFLQGNADNPEEVTAVFARELETALLAIKEEENQELFRQLFACGLADIVNMEELNRLVQSKGYTLAPVVDEMYAQSYDFYINHDQLTVKIKTSFNIRDPDQNGMVMGRAIMEQEIDLKGALPTTKAGYKIRWDN